MSPYEREVALRPDREQCFMQSQGSHKVKSMRKVRSIKVIFAFFFGTE